MNARVLIVAPDDRLAGPLTEGLDRLGWRSITARGPEAARAALRDLDVEVVIVDTGEGDPAMVSLPPVLKADRAPRRLPVVALGRPDPLLQQLGFDLALSPPLHPVQAALRLESLVRGAVAEEEFELRRETFAERGRPLANPTPSTAPLRVLTVGEPAPKFLALAYALRAMGAQVVAALTAYTAFDYLHEDAFDAVVLWAGETHAEALSIAGGMRRNTRLYHIPTVLYLREGAEVALNEAYNKGLSDVATAGTPEDETARRVMSLAVSYRRETEIRLALDEARASGMMDAATGLFTRDLFAAHLGRLARAARERGRPLTVAVLKIADKPETLGARRDGWLDRAIPQIGSMIGRLVRAQDTAARLAPEMFALALPAANLASGRIAADRIAAVIACTAFDAGETRLPFTIEFDVGVAELQPGEPAARTLERAAATALAKQAG